MTRKAWEFLKELWADFILAGYAGFTTWVFIYIKIHGIMYIVEETPWILWAEIILSPSVFALAAERSVKDILYFRRRGKH